MENKTPNKSKKVVVGGTFDSLHKGHKHLLKKATSLGNLKIGLTSNEMARKTKGIGVEKHEERHQSLLYFFPEAKIEKINDSYGFALDEDFDFIVVSSETRLRAEKINSERRAIGRKNLEIVEVDLLLAEDGEPISSTRIREGEIDKEGKKL